MKLNKFDWLKYYLKRLSNAKTKSDVIKVRDDIIYIDHHDLDKRTMFRLGELVQRNLDDLED